MKHTWTFSLRTTLFHIFIFSFMFLHMRHWIFLSLLCVTLYVYISTHIYVYVCSLDLYSCFSSLWSILLYLYVVSVFPIKSNSCSPKFTVKIRLARSSEKSGNFLKFEHFPHFFLLLVPFSDLWPNFERLLNGGFTSEINYDYDSLIL